MHSRTRRHAFVHAFAFTDTSANTCMYTQQCADADMSLNALAKLTRSRKRSRPHISAALPAHTIVSCYSLPSEQREGRGEQLAVTLVPRISIGAMQQLKLDEHNVSNKQQLQKPTTEQVLLADFHVELWPHLSLLGNWKADQFTCIICILTLREVIMVKIVHIIMEFLQYYFTSYYISLLWTL